MKAPERIYLVDPDIDEEEDAGPGMAPETEGVYWCEDRVHKSDVEYIRADVAAAKAEPAEDAARLRHAGAMLSNCAFNMAQRKPGEPLTEGDIRALDESRKAWDAAIKAEAERKNAAAGEKP